MSTPYEYAVTRHWHDDPHDNFGVLDYFPDILAAQKYIDEQPKDPRYRLEIMTFREEEEPVHSGS